MRCAPVLTSEAGLVDTAIAPSQPAHAVGALWAFLVVATRNVVLAALFEGVPDLPEGGRGADGFEDVGGGQNTPSRAQ